jgi:hypothetical protein
MKGNQSWIIVLLIGLIIVVIMTVCVIGYFAFFRPLNRQPTPGMNEALTQAVETISAQVTADALQTLIAQATQAVNPSPTPPLYPTAGPSPTFIYPTQPLPPTSTTVFIPPTATSPAIPCNRAAFVRDVTIPDGTVLAPNTPFRKTWRVRNDGSCTWDARYFLVFVNGTPMTSQTAVPFPGVVGPGQTVDLSVDLAAPANPGTYQGNWMFRAPNGQTFGTGSGNTPVFVRINVTQPVTPNPRFSYDLAANFCSATWRTDAGVIGCNNPTSDPRGSVTLVVNPPLERAVENEPGLVVRPNQANNGYILGQYPSYQVKANDHFISEISCARGYTSCNVIFQVDYQLPNGAIGTLGRWGEVADGKTRIVDVNLAPLAGQTVQFILRMFNNGTVSQAVGIWFLPSVRNIQPTATLPPPPTLTPIPPSATPTLIYPTVPIITVPPTISYPTATLIPPSP